MSNEGNNDQQPDSASAAEAGASRALYAYGDGVRTTLRHNATAYGFSISITTAFGLVTTSHPGHVFGLPALAFAGGALLAFVLTDVVASRAFRRVSSSETADVMMVSGAVDVLSVGLAVTGAVGLAQVPGLLAWPLTAFGTTLVYLLVGGLDVLIARRAARRTING